MKSPANAFLITGLVLIAAALLGSTFTGKSRKSFAYALLLCAFAMMGITTLQGWREPVTRSVPATNKI